MNEINKFKASLTEFGALNDSDTVKTATVERIEPQYANEWPEQLHPAVLEALNNSGTPRPYRHQAEAISKSLGGADVVLESPTASGKTLAFTVPILDTLKRHRDSHALMIYPMKSLAFDQRDQIRNLCDPLSIESWTYDGDTDKEHKDTLRKKPPPILLTNPEYLNLSFLCWREKWESFLRNLQYVVIDEMHEYRGFFGSNMALLLRRFFLHLHRIGANPKVFLSTATCANPKEHARTLTGRNVEVVSARDVLRPKRGFIFVNPAIADYKYRDALRQRVERAALTVLSENSKQALVFCPTKRFLEEAFRNCKYSATEKGLNTKRISAFHADLKIETRQKIQQNIKSGNISVVFTTNALELGLDIGGLDRIILAGFPPSIMSAWQQIGRAGRGWDKNATVLFYAMNDPIDRFFVGNLNAFLNKPFDQLVVDPNNEELIEGHLASLVNETNGKLKPSDKSILGATFYDVALKDGGKPVKGYQPQREVKIRSGIGQSYKLKHGNKEDGQVSEMRRFREAYIGAIFTFFGQRYHVRSYEEKTVILDSIKPHLVGMKTEPNFFTTLYKQNFFAGFCYGEIEVYYGSLDIIMNFNGYKLVDETTGEVKGAGGIPGTLFMRNHHAFWIDTPPTVPSDGIGALEHLIRVGAMFVIPADRFDTSTSSKVKETTSAFYYESYAGGIGVAKKLFNVWQETLKKGVEIARACKCRSGCPNCIAPAKSYDISNEIDKVAGIKLAENLLATVSTGPDRKFHNGRWVSINKEGD